jgi:hypothetical protein
MFGWGKPKPVLPRFTQPVEEIITQIEAGNAVVWIDVQHKHTIVNVNIGDYKFTIKRTPVEGPRMDRLDTTEPFYADELRMIDRAIKNLASMEKAEAVLKDRKAICNKLGVSYDAS